MTEKKPKKPMSTKKAIENLVDLKRGLFPYLHRDYNEALDIAMEKLKEELEKGN